MKDESGKIESTESASVQNNESPGKGHDKKSSQAGASNGPELARKTNLWVKIAAPLLVFSMFAAGFLGYDYISGKVEKKKPSPIGTIRLKEPENPRVKELTEGMETIFFMIREANLDKNINLYASCFATSFRAIEERKGRVLANWKSYDFTDLNFTLKKIRMKENSVEVAVHWVINARSVKTRVDEVFRTTNYVELTKENGLWKISAVK